MIFSGSENRARLGMASATITFDNSDGWLPIDFSEVGDRPPRLPLRRKRVPDQRAARAPRDVSELLSGAAWLSAPTPSSGRGWWMLLGLRPDERRRLFEEAAGIGLHRSRREEALRRLETHSRNLERVEDILAELKPRLHSLERQARRAQEYAQVRRDLEILLHEWYGFHWHETQKELAEFHEVVTSMKNSSKQNGRTWKQLKLAWATCATASRRCVST